MFKFIRVLSKWEAATVIQRQNGFQFFMVNYVNFCIVYISLVTIPLSLTANHDFRVNQFQSFI